MINALMDSLVSKRWYFFAITSAILLTVSLQIAHMAFNGNVKVMFDENDKHYQRLLELETTYEDSNYLVVLFQPANKNVFEEQSLKQLHGLLQAIEQLPYVQRVDALPNHPRITVNGDNLDITALIETVDDLNPLSILALKQYTQSQGNLSGHFVSENGRVAALFAATNLPDNNHLAAIHALGKEAQQLKQHFEQQYPGSTLYLNGDIAIEHALLNVIMDDILRVNPVVFATIFLLVGLLLRTTMAMSSTIAVVAFSTTIATGINVALGFEMNPITMMAPAIIMVLAVADSVHVLTIYSVQCRAGESPERAMLFSLKKNIGPVFWTSITTVAGFMGLNFGDSPPFRSMGNMAAIGIIIAFICTFTVLPSVALLFSSKQLSKPWSLADALARFSHWKGHGKPSLLIAAIALSLGLGFAIPTMKLNDDISNYFDDSLEINNSIQFAKEHIDGAQTILYSMNTGSENGIYEPAFLNQVDAFSQWLRNHAEVARVESYVDIIKQLNQRFNQDNPTYYAVPNNRQLNAQYTLLYELALPAGMELTHHINSTRSEIKLTVSLHNSDNQTLIQLENDIHHWLDANMPALNNQGSSQLLLFAHMGTKILHSMIDGSAFTFLFVTAFMIFAFRSVKFGLLSIIPNVFPALVLYGIWALWVGQVNHAAAMTFTICLGLVVDDSIHLISKYLDARRQGKHQQMALQYALSTSGTAIVITTITLTCGILLLSLSHFAVNDTLALMLAAIIVLALLFDLLILPSLLLLADKKSNAPQPAVASPSNYKKEVFL